MRVSCVVRAHPHRRDLVDDLLAHLDRPAEVVWDWCEYGWDTGMRAWQAVDLSADYGLVIEDDALPCRDLISGLEWALQHVSATSVVSPYLGNMTGVRQFDPAVKRARRFDASWIRAKSLVWGVAIAVPTSTIDDMLTWCDGPHKPPFGPHVYDTRIARYYSRILRCPAWFTWPSLVDHRQTPSLIGHADGRKARRFIGEDVSALSVDWSGAVVERK